MSTIFGPSSTEFGTSPTRNGLMSAAVGRFQPGSSRFRQLWPSSAEIRPTTGRIRPTADLAGPDANLSGADVCLEADVASPDPIWWIGKDFQHRCRSQHQRRQSGSSSKTPTSGCPFSREIPAHQTSGRQWTAPLSALTSEIVCGSVATSLAKRS